MGVGKSTAAAGPPALYGTPGELGPLRGVVHSALRTAAAQTPLVLAVGSLYVDQYNAESADRRQRIRRSNDSLITSVAFCTQSPFGFVALTGTLQGTVALYAVDSMREFKTIRSEGAGGGAAASGAGSLTGLGGIPLSSNPTTAVACFSSSVFFAGQRDGSVRAFQFSTGDVLQKFMPPADAPMTDMTVPADRRVASPRALNPVPTVAPAGGAAAELAAAAERAVQQEVTAIAVWGPAFAAAGPLMLAVGHRDGTIHCYELATGRWLLGFQTPPGLTQLLPMRRFGSLAALHEGRNAMQIWDLETDRSVVLDFTAELDSIGRRTSKMAAAWFDEARAGACCDSCDSCRLLLACALSLLP